MTKFEKIQKRIKEIEAKENKLDFTEGNMNSINQLQRVKIKLVRELSTYKRAVLYNVNRGEIITHYSTGKIYNWSCDFAMPYREQRIVNLIAQWRKKADTKILDQIFDNSDIVFTNWV